ncbi:MAG: hypothetical protein J4F97_05590, partial [Pseudomonadales bacterium]|nr:hypothetical protein [Pseudomonadales bacterium]
SISSSHRNGSGSGEQLIKRTPSVGSDAIESGVRRRELNVVKGLVGVAGLARVLSVLLRSQSVL